MNKFLIILLWFALCNITLAQEDAIYISNDGKVGIGTSDPKADLDIKGNTKVNGSMTVQGNVETKGAIQVSGRIMEKGYDLVPKGTIIMWYPPDGSLKPPAGWAFCDGQNGTPNLQGRFLMGTDKAENLGKTGGSELVEFKAENIPTHQHKTIPRWVVKSYDRTANIAQTNTITFNSYYDNVTKSITSETRQTNLIGETEPILNNNLPPFYSLYYIIKL